MKIYKGDYVEVEIPVKVEETGAAFDITGYDFKNKIIEFILFVHNLQK